MNASADYLEGEAEKSNIGITGGSVETKATGRRQVFISYSHKDAEWVERLRVHLKPLERHGLEIWDDTRMTP